MIRFRTFVFFAMLIHASLFGLSSWGLWSPPEISLVPPQSSVNVRFRQRQPQAETKAQKETAKPFSAKPKEPLTAVPPKPESIPATLSVPTEERPNDSSAKKQRRKTKRERQKTPSDSPIREEKKAEQSLVPNNTVEQLSPEPEKELVLGQGNAPSYARFFPPEYPPKARRMNIQGRVLLRVLVNKEGRAAAVEVVESTHPDFTRAARKSAQRSSYVPMKRTGQPAEAWVIIPFHFQLR